MKQVFPRLRRPQTPISVVGSDKSASAVKMELNLSASGEEILGKPLNSSSKSPGPGSAIGKLEFVEVGKHDVDSSFLKNKKY